LFVRLRISPARIKLAASNFARWFKGVLGRESPILGNFALQKPKIGRIGHPRGSKVYCWKSYRNRVRIKFEWRVDVGSACMHIRPSPKTDVGPTCFRFPVLYGSFLTPAMSVHERRLSPVHTSNNVEATLSNVTRRTILSVCLFSFYLFNRLTVELDSCMYVCMGHDHSSPGTESQGQMSTRSVSPRSSTEDSFCSLNMRSTCLPFMLHREYEMTSPFSGAPRMPDRV